MKKLLAEDLFALEYGDKVYLRRGSYFQKFDYVARMPSSSNYLIFSAGETLKHLYIHKDGSFQGEWYAGKYDDKFVITLQIDTLRKEIESLEKDLKEEYNK